MLDTDPQKVLDLINDWKAAFATLETQTETYKGHVERPGGSYWEGVTFEAAQTQAWQDYRAVSATRDAVDTASQKIANTVSSELMPALLNAQRIIANAEAYEGVTVNEDLSITYDPPTGTSEEAAAKNRQAIQDAAEELKESAETWWAAEQSTANQIADMQKAVGEHINFTAALTDIDQAIALATGQPVTKTAGATEPTSGPATWQDMLLSPGAKPDTPPGTTSPLDAMTGTKTATDADQPANLNEALDDVAGQPLPQSPTLTEQILNPQTGTGKPGDPRYTKSPLESPIVGADPSLVDQQHARVIAAEQNLATSQAALDDTAGRAYAQGAGTGLGETVPLSQTVFAARAELTAQSDLLTALNQAAAENSLPIAAVSDLPANADVQALPAEPPVFERAKEALTEGAKDAAETVWDATMPDVANMYDVVTDWEDASEADKRQAAIDAAGMVPVPGAKLFGEGIETGLDALGIAGRHTDDIPTTVADDVVDTAGPGAHSVPDGPSITHAEIDVGPVTSFGFEDTHHLLATSEASGGHLVDRHVGQTVEDLSARLETTRLPIVSSFDTVDEAAAAVSTTLQRNSHAIDEWLANGAVRNLQLDAPFNGGAVLERGSPQAVAGTGARVVLKGDGNGGWLVLTGFPTP